MICLIPEAPSIVRKLRIPDIAWIEIPAGKFVYGDDKQRTTRHLEAF